MDIGQFQHIVEKEGLGVVSKRLGVSPSAICHIVKGTYKARPDRILRLAEEAYSQQIIECPVLGEIALSRCIQEKNRPFAAINPTRAKLARTCPRCGQSTAHSRGGDISA